MSGSGLALFVWQWQKTQPPSVSLAAPCEDDCTLHSDLPPVIVYTWKVWASLWMASVNAADRGITSSHNFWLLVADACCQTVQELLSFVTFSCGCHKAGPRPARPQTKKSPRCLWVTFCLPAIICQLTQSTALKGFDFQRWSSWWHSNAFKIFQTSSWFLYVWNIIVFQESLPYIKKPGGMVPKF